MARWADCVESDPEEPPPAPRTTSNNRYMKWLQDNPCTQKYLACLRRENELTRLEKAEAQSWREFEQPWLQQTGRRRSTSMRKYDARRRVEFPDYPEKVACNEIIDHAMEVACAPKSNY